MIKYCFIMAFSCANLLKKLLTTEIVNENLQKENVITTFSSVNKDISDGVADILNGILTNICEINHNTESTNNHLLNDVDSKKSLEGTNSYCTETTFKDTFKCANVDGNAEYVTIEENNVMQEFDFNQIPLQITGAWSEFKNSSKNNYTRGCKWAPDGSCILTCNDDNILRIFNLPLELWDFSKWNEISEMVPALKISEGELIYDNCWYPLMKSSDPTTCCLASCARNSTVHLWDAFSGSLRCSYRTYDQMDEIITGRSLSFDAFGEKIFCGFEKMIRVFNVNLPGRNCEERRIFDKKSGQSGIISCFAFTTANRNISAAGSYNKTIGIYSEPDGSLECVLEGHKGGLTHLQFSPDGNLLYSGGRKDCDILCWDLRNLGEVLFCMRRTCMTSQRMYFDLSRDGRYVISGNTNGVITVWDTIQEPRVFDSSDISILEPLQYFLAHDDCVNGISIHPEFPLLCSSSGQRKFLPLLPDDEDDLFAQTPEKSDNSLRLWWIGKCS